MPIDPATFLGPTMNGCFRSDHVWIWYRKPGLWTTVIWGRPTEDDREKMTSTWSLALGDGFRETFDSVVDCSRLVGVDAFAFNALATYMKTNAAGFRARLARQALVRPDGLVGAAISGFFALLGYAPAIEIFTHRSDAYRWLYGANGDEIDREFETKFQGIDASSVMLQSLRTLLAERLNKVDLERAAKQLGTSSRSLQRTLAASGTSFRAEIHAAQVRAARERLLHTDQKIAIIAAAVGYDSAHHFARVFKEIEGVGPQEWRERQRK